VYIDILMSNVILHVILYQFFTKRKQLTLYTACNVTHAVIDRKDHSGYRIEKLKDR